MSKMLEAICAAGVVTSGGIPVPAADILSKGIGPSTGVLILDEDKAKYITSNASDIESTLTQIASVLQTISTALTAIGAAMTGPTTAPPPTLPADIASITLAIVQINILKASLK